MAHYASGRESLPERIDATELPTPSRLTFQILYIPRDKGPVESIARLFAGSLNSIDVVVEEIVEARLNRVGNDGDHELQTRAGLDLRQPILLLGRFT
jgi:hypothetical protein